MKMIEKPTIGQLQRKIERLEAKLAEIEKQYDKVQKINREYIYAVCKKCNIEMRPGVLIDCLKCSTCGWSMTVPTLPSNAELRPLDAAKRYE